MHKRQNVTAFRDTRGRNKNRHKLARVITQAVRYSQTLSSTSRGPVKRKPCHPPRIAPLEWTAHQVCFCYTLLALTLVCLYHCTSNGHTCCMAAAIHGPKIKEKCSRPVVSYTRHRHLHRH